MNMPRLMGRAVAAGRLPDPCGIAEIAPRFGHSADWFQRRWPELVKRYGFPPPLPMTRRKWPAAAVEAWFADIARRVALPPSVISRPPPSILDDGDDGLADILDRRAVELADRDHA